MSSFDYETLTYDDRKSIHDALAETTVAHITGAPGLFEPMPFDTAASPSQRLEVTHLEPAPSTFDEIQLLANFASQGTQFDKFVFDEMRHQAWFFNSVRSLIRDHVHIFPVTPHGNIADIAFWQAGWVQNIGQDDWQDRSGLAISRGVTTIKAFDMAASEVVQKIGHVFLSFPRTPTIEALAKKYKARAAQGEAPDLDIDSLISTNNKNMRSDVKQWMGIGLTHVIGRKKGKAFHSAWSGKTDKVRWGDDGKPESIELGKVSEGTIDLVKNGLVLPVAVWYGDNPMLEIGELTRVTNNRDAKRVQNWQAERLANHHGLDNNSVTVEH